ncbi:uncharacterized protein LOC114743047 [Neltuma alba]|uniref:uncharacterized protein LOC114743047 n=1 Tax=Neltuma alba TaxID=207710 RepID=UPI0010A52381|nr:uncharacterized protein LOC114743047 [Prosopis alba]
MVRMSLIKNLHDGTDRWSIIVRVMRKWNIYQKNTPGDVFGVTMLLLDEDGTTIQATVLNRNIMARYKTNIVEGNTYLFANFIVSQNGNQYRASTHPFKITFTPQTFFADHNVSLPAYSYSFFPISEILKATPEHHVQHLFDVMAFVKAMGTLEEFRRDNETKSKLRMILTDARENDIECVLFDDCAIDAFMAQLQNTETPVVGLFNLARIGFSEDGVGESFVVKCTVKKLETYHGWTYDGCSKCAAKTRLEGTSVMCPICKKVPDAIEPKLRIHYMVEDDTGSASLIFWDKQAIQLINKSTTELKLLMQQDNRPAYDFPDELEDPVGKVLLVKMKLNEYNKKHPTSAISVGQFTICEDLMDQFMDANVEVGEVNARNANNDSQDVPSLVEITDNQDSHENVSPVIPQPAAPQNNELEDVTLVKLANQVTPVTNRVRRRSAIKRNVGVDVSASSSQSLPTKDSEAERVYKVIKKEK